MIDGRDGTGKTCFYVHIFSPLPVCAITRLRRKRRLNDSDMKDRTSKKAVGCSISLIFEYSFEMLKKCISRLVGYEAEHFDHGLITSYGYFSLNIVDGEAICHTDVNSTIKSWNSLNGAQEFKFGLAARARCNDVPDMGVYENIASC